MRRREKEEGDTGSIYNGCYKDFADCEDLVSSTIFLIPKAIQDGYHATKVLVVMRETVNSQFQHGLIYQCCFQRMLQDPDNRLAELLTWK